MNKNSFLKSDVSASGSVLVTLLMLGAQPAFAQSEQAPKGSAVVQQADGEIIVTAQRREEKLIDVPISITALSGNTLAATQTQNIRDLTFVTPGLNFQAFGNSAQPNIRGVGSTSSSVGDGSNVPIYIDGVYQPYQGSNYVKFGSIERIEVLKGPQGTLYGRNAAGGAIVIKTLDPSFDTNGKLSLRYGRFNAFEANGYLSGPIVADRLAMNISADYIHTDGFRRDIFLNKTLGYTHYFSLRSKLLFDSGTGVKAILTGYYQNGNDLVGFGNQPLNGNTSVRLANPSILIPTEKNTTALNYLPSNRVRQWGGNLKVDVDLDWATLTSLTAVNRVRQRTSFDSDQTPAASSQSNAVVNIDMTTQDLTLVSQLDGPFSFVLGGSYYAESGFVGLQSYGGLTVFSANPPLTSQIEADVDTRAWAVFGEASYALTESLKLTAGLRYSWEKTGFVGRSLNLATGQFRAPVSSLPSRNGKLTPRLSLQYKISPQINTYVSFSRGYKSGVVNPLALQLAPAAPETIDAYQIGIKGEPSHSISFDTAAFYYDYKNLQFQAFGLNSVSPILQNAAKAEIYGIEANAAVRPVPELQLRLGLAYTRGKYTSFVGAQVFRPRVDAQGNILGGNIGTKEDVSGAPLIRIPRFQATGAIAYQTVLSNGSKFEFNVNGSYNGRKYYDVAQVFSQSGYAIFNASAGYTLPGDHLKFSLYAKNIFNALPLISVQPSASATGVLYQEPATYGVKVDYSF